MATSSSRAKPSPTARAVAWRALQRIDHKGAFANLVLGAELDRADLSDQDRRFATQLVYGTTRMRRSCDFLVDRFALRTVDPDIRSLLRLGAYQLHYLSTPAHAAVDATVAEAPRKARGFVNAILRRVADAETTDTDDGGTSRSGDVTVWPNEATRLSYPDWLVNRLVNDLGHDDAIAMLERMNVEPSVHERADGYVQDPASQWVCDVVDAQAGELILDACAAPGGKATLLAASGATVVAADRRAKRAKLVTTNAERVGASAVHVAVADGATSPWRDRAYDRVLIDAPCSGLGVLRRRPDARWRIDADGIERLAALQVRLLTEAQRLVRPGGRLVYSVCTVTKAETVDPVATVAGDDFEPLDVPGSVDAFARLGDFGGQVLPQHHDSDGMSVFAWQRLPG